MQFSGFYMISTRKTGSFAQNWIFMRRRSTRSNNNFLLGSLILIVLVLAMVFLFLYLSFQ